MSANPVEKAFIAIGSNIDPERNLPEAVGMLRSLGRMVAVSRAYRNVPVGGRKQPDFLNAAALIKANMAPSEIRTQLRRIESQLGRVRSSDKYASRTIDLDLVLLGDRVDKQFPLPDPGILTRQHIALPLAELDPDYCHPVTGEALGTIAARLADGGMQPDNKVSQRLADILAESLSGSD